MSPLMWTSIFISLMATMALILSNMKNFENSTVLKMKINSKENKMKW